MTKATADIIKTSSVLSVGENLSEFPTIMCAAKNPTTVPRVFVIKSLISDSLKAKICKISMAKVIPNPNIKVYLNSRNFFQIKGSRKPRGTKSITFRTAFLKSEIISTKGIILTSKSTVKFVISGIPTTEKTPEKIKRK